MLKGLFKKIQNAVIVDFEEEEESAEEDDDDISFSDADTFDDEYHKSNDQENSKDQSLFKYYKIVKDLSEFFPGKDFLNDSNALHKSISEMMEEISNLDSQKKEVDDIYGYYLKSCGLEKEIKSVDEKLKMINEDFNKLKANLKNLNDVMKSNEELVKRTNEDVVKRQVEQLKRTIAERNFENEKIRNKIKELKEKITNESQANKNVEMELKKEKDLYDKIIMEINSFQIKSQNSLESDQKLNELEKEVANKKNELSELEKMIEKDLPKIPDLEKEAQELGDEYSQIYSIEQEDKKKENTFDERVYISNLLVNYYKGDKDTVNKFKELFEWTDTEMQSLNKENRGFLGFLNKGKRYFNGFRDLWTNWLISASENN